MVPRVPSPRPLGQHNHTPSYQCFGEYCYVDLPGLHLPKVVEATQHPLEDQQHHSLDLCQERRGDLQSASPGDRGEDSGQGSPDVRRILPVFIPTGENILADAASRFQEIPDWQLLVILGLFGLFNACMRHLGTPDQFLFVATGRSQRTIVLPASCDSCL
jgi:hypothetical protein